ncbi:hypothetical protein AA0483_0289 [Acetobacter syzygii NRIC 0483]|nr:hypothetical protein AA0483_0289 [Acetobacter syzygii NRIC 0483]
MPFVGRVKRPPQQANAATAVIPPCGNTKRVGLPVRPHTLHVPMTGQGNMPPHIRTMRTPQAACLHITHKHGGNTRDGARRGQGRT